MDVLCRSENRRRVRLLLLHTDVTLATDSVLAHCCEADPQMFEHEKLGHLPLDHWTKQELQDWLDEYWNHQYSTDDRKMLAQNIFLASDQGRPSDLNQSKQLWDSVTTGSTGDTGKRQIDSTSPCAPCSPW